MIALAQKLNAEGKTSVGTSGNYFTKDYKTLKNLVKFGLLTLPEGKYEVSLWHHRDDSYKEPFKKFIQNVRSNGVISIRKT